MRLLLNNKTVPSAKQIIFPSILRFNNPFMIISNYILCIFKSNIGSNTAAHGFCRKYYYNKIRY